MGSATTQALTAARDSVSKLGKVDLAAIEQLLDAGAVIADSRALLSALTSFEGDSTAKLALAKQVFASLDKTALGLLEKLVASRWSKPVDLLAGIEDTAVRAAVSAAPKVAIDEELIAVARAVRSDNELELALGSKLSPRAAKLALLEKLFGKSLSPVTLVIVRHLVTQPRGRRIGESLRQAAVATADEAGFELATVTVATPLGAEHLDRLARVLAGRYGRTVRINLIVDPEVLGGLKVQVGNDIIDGSIAARLTELRLKLAG